MENDPKLSEVAVRLYRRYLNSPKDESSYQSLLADGMVSREALKDGQWYFGHCRNASTARWNAKVGRFVYTRFKFGTSFLEEIEHPYDDRGFDVFVPVKETAPPLTKERDVNTD